MNYQRLNYPNGYKKIIGPNKPCPNKPMPNMPIPNIPTPPMPPQGQIPNNNQPVLNLFPVDEGYVKGTIFRGLYKPYLNYEPIMPLIQNEQQKMLFDVNKNHFAMIELSFYLNNYPNDQDAISKFNGFRRDYLKAKGDYENKYGALDISSNQLERTPWNWVQTLAPWMRGV